MKWFTLLVSLLTSVSTVVGEPPVVGTWKLSLSESQFFVLRIDPSGSASLTMTAYLGASFVLPVDEDSLATVTPFTAKAVFSGTWDVVGDTLLMTFEKPKVTVNDMDPETYIAETVPLIVAEMARAYEELYGKEASEELISGLEERIEEGLRSILKENLTSSGFEVASLYELDGDTLTLIDEEGRAASSWERVPEESIATGVRPASWGQIKKATVERYRSR